MHAICSSLIILIIFDAENKAQSSSLCNVHKPPWHFIPIRSKYSRQHSVLIHLHSVFSVNVSNTAWLLDMIRLSSLKLVLSITYVVCINEVTYLFSFQIELEKLNNATDEINKLEIELDVSILDMYV